MGKKKKKGKPKSYFKHPKTTQHHDTIFFNFLINQTKVKKKKKMGLRENENRCTPTITISLNLQNPMIDQRKKKSKETTE